VDTLNNVELTPQQEAAINLLLTGFSMLDTAKTLNVPYSTIRRWVSTHSGFKAEFEGRQKDISKT
jgi:transposase-like protein